MGSGLVGCVANRPGAGDWPVIKVELHAGIARVLGTTYDSADRSRTKAHLLPESLFLRGLVGSGLTIRRVDDGPHDLVPAQFAGLEQVEQVAVAAELEAEVWGEGPGLDREEQPPDLTMRSGQTIGLQAPISTRQAWA